MTFHYKGRTVLITGASSGIGESFARELAKLGANLILTARSKDRLEALASELRNLPLTLPSPHPHENRRIRPLADRGEGWGEGNSKISVHVIVSDLSQPSGPLKIFEAVREKGLAVDLLINNAGLGACGYFEKTAEDRVTEILQVNVNALVTLTHLFLPGMLKRKQGGILNVASTAGFQPLPKLGLYAATKAFVLSFSEALWAENKNRGIRVFCLCPGNTKTPFHEIAGMQRRTVFFAAEAGEVARFGLKVFAGSGKPTAVYGWTNRILALGHRLIPRSWVVRIASLIYPD